MGRWAKIWLCMIGGRWGYAEGPNCIAYAWTAPHLLSNKGTRRRLIILRSSLVAEEPLWFFILGEIPFFDYKSNFSDFVFLAEWQNLKVPLCIDASFQQRLTKLNKVNKDKQRSTKLRFVEKHEKCENIKIKWKSFRTSRHSQQILFALKIAKRKVAPIGLTSKKAFCIKIDIFAFKNF